VRGHCERCDLPYDDLQHVKADGGRPFEVHLCDLCFKEWTAYVEQCCHRHAAPKYQTFGYEWTFGSGGTTTTGGSS
jgi:hypothetical protein